MYRHTWVEYCLLLDEADLSRALANEASAELVYTGIFYAITIRFEPGTVSSSDDGQKKTQGCWQREEATCYGRVLLLMYSRSFSSGHLHVTFRRRLQQWRTAAMQAKGSTRAFEATRLLLSLRTSLPDLPPVNHLAAHLAVASLRAVCVARATPSDAAAAANTGAVRSGVQINEEAEFEDVYVMHIVMSDRNIE